MNVQASQKIYTVESKIDIVEISLNKKLDGLQSDLDQKIDILQYSISRLTNQENVHQKEENPKEECLINITVEEHCKQKNEVIFPLLNEDGDGKEAVEKPQNLILKPLPIKLDPSATTQATNSSLATTPSSDLVHILPTPVEHSTPETPTAKAIPSALHVQHFKKLVAFVETFATTSKKLAAAYTTWHNGWLIQKPSWFRFGAPGPQQLHQLHQFPAASKGLRNLFFFFFFFWGGGGGGGGAQSPPLFCFEFFFVILFSFLLIYLVFLFIFL